MAEAALAFLGALQDLLDTSPVLRAELQLRTASCTVHNSLPPPQKGGRSKSFPYRMVPRKVDFSGVEPTYKMCTLAKRELMLQTCT